jgi:archaellum component FlaC
MGLMKVKKESVDEKIDNLAVMVAKGFDGVHKEFAEVHNEIDDMHKEIKEFREEINQSLENHIKTVRTDYDGLAGRVKRLEITRR